MAHILHTCRTKPGRKDRGRRNTLVGADTPWCKSVGTSFRFVVFSRISCFQNGGRWRGEHPPGPLRVMERPIHDSTPCPALNQTEEVNDALCMTLHGEFHDFLLEKRSAPPFARSRLSRVEEFSTSLFYSGYPAKIKTQYLLYFFLAANHALRRRVQPWTGHKDGSLYCFHGESLQHLHCGWFHIHIIDQYITN